MRKASRIYKRKSRTNLETFIILIGAIIILGVAFNLARDRSYIPPESQITREEENKEGITQVIPGETPQEVVATEEKGETRTAEKEITQEVITEEKLPTTEPVTITTPKIEPEVKVVKESEIVSDKKVYTVQVGAFSKEEGAQKLAKEIRDKGYQTYVIIGKTLYKVQVGEFKTSEEAKAISEKLKKLGYEIWITTK
ncbi:SPOR domain-containing protein [bacterium]|nr:SPOR domain-containing protein [bacterium]MBU4227838.1 SPOR domain-containing protein [bacterium]MBU4362439.1 SPOR domain-containing protein [bacterium]MBU4601762.1 SPOR domain-containing protein [bacterium]